MASVHAATRRFERLIGYRGPDTLYTTPPDSEDYEPNLNPTIGEVFDDTADFIGVVVTDPNTKDTKFIRLEEEAREQLAGLCNVINSIISERGMADKTVKFDFEAYM